MAYQCSHRQAIISYQATMQAGCFSVIIYLLCITGILGFDNRIRPSCALDSEVCEFSVIVQHRYTMMHYSNDGLGTMSPVSADGLGRLWQRRKNCSGEDLVPEEEIDDIVIGDGSHKLMMLVNDSLPGPAMVVYEGQQVAVKIINNLGNEGITIHFHGVLQRGTPWMDGAEGVSQCSINPRESFTYRFFAQQVGTYWYHSHQGTQRTMGVYGPFIVLPREPPKSLPKIEEEFVAVLQDFMRKDSMDISIITTTESVSFAYGFTSEHCFNSTKQADGFDCGVTPFVSGVINGKGRHYNEMNGDIEDAHIPLEIFTVKKGRFYRMRIISAAMTFAFQLSIDGHPLHVISMDGVDIKPVKVDSLIIFSGERYDVLIEAKDPLDVGNYWIRAITLERKQNGVHILAGRTEAILHYKGSPNDEPLTSRPKCTASSPCPILNCPYQQLPKGEHSPCIPVSDMRATKGEPTLVSEDNEEIVEHFLNFHFAGFKTKGIWKTTINGKINILPTTPVQLYRGNLADIGVPCDEKKCLEDICRCTHVLELPLGKVIQFNLAITVNNPVGVYNGNNHPIHIHGHRFQVLKTGWPEYDPVTRIFTHINRDFACTTDSCSKLRWTNESWSGGNVPGVTLQGAPQKDTIAIPIGGYVVARFKADNPGYWLMHCHTEFHNVEGMSMIIKVGDTSNMVPPPPNMKSCGSFSWSNEEFLQIIKKHKHTKKLQANSVQPGDTPIKREDKSSTYIPAIIALALLGLIFTVGLVLFLRRRGISKSWKYEPLETAQFRD